MPADLREYPINESDRALLTLALRIAAEQFQRDTEPAGTPKTIVDQFKAQIEHAERLIDQIEASEEVVMRRML